MLSAEIEVLAKELRLRDGTRALKIIPGRTSPALTARRTSFSVLTRYTLSAIGTCSRL